MTDLHSDAEHATTAGLGEPLPYLPELPSGQHLLEGLGASDPASFDIWTTVSII